LGGVAATRASRTRSSPKSTGGWSPPAAGSALKQADTQAMFRCPSGLGLPLGRASRAPRGLASASRVLEASTLASRRRWIFVRAGRLVPPV